MGGDSAKVHDWRADQYQWGVDNGTTKSQVNSELILVKSYKKLYKGSTFQRHAWWFLHNPHVVLIQYIEDHTEFQPRPHGDSVFNNRNYKRTCPSVIADTRPKPQDDNITTYQDLVKNECPNEQQAVLKPRNIKQVRNNKFIARKNAKLSHDDYYNLLVISNELESYVFEVICFLDLTCFFGNKELLSQLNKLLQLKQTENDMQLYCGYDTAFNLGNFYLTPLVFRHTLFDKDPVIPVAFMIHKKKFQSVHERFWHHLLLKLPNLEKTQLD